MKVPFYQERNYIGSFQTEPTFISRIKSLREVGAAVGIGGLLLAADLAITGGLFTSLAVLPIGLASMMGWTLYKSADALSELGSFKGLETCLESKGYDVVFYIESKK